MDTSRTRASSTRPTATVVIPCYNYGRFLDDCVRSALDQADVDVDVIIVDDASPDGSVDIARRLAAADPRVRVIAHTTNKRHIRTYNDGLSEATGDYVVLLSADDLLTPNAITRAVEVMQARPDVGLVYGPVAVFADEVPVLGPPTATAEVVWDGREWARRLYRHGVNVIKSPEAIVRTSVLRRVGLYDVAHPHAGDLQMWLRIAAIADVAYLPGAVQAYYRQHDLNMHTAVFATDHALGMMTDLRHRLDAFTTAAQHFDTAATLIESIRHAEAEEAMDLAARAHVWGLTRSWPVEDLVAFARECDPDIDRRPSGRAYRRRRAVGARLSRKNPAFVVRERMLRARERARERSVAQTGLPS